MVEWVADAAIVAGRLRASERAAFVKPEWSPHGWDYIHPVQDVQGKKLAIEAGITSRTAVQAETGEDPRKVQAQREADRKDDEARGLLPPEQKPAAPGKPATDPSPTAVEKLLSGVTMRLDALDAQRAQPSVVETVQAGMVQMMQMMQAQHLEREAQREAERAAERKEAEAREARMAAAHAEQMAASKAFMAEMFAGFKETMLAVAARPITPPSVNVTATAEPTPVVVNNQIDVQPATVEVTLPDRVSETDLVHDDDGNLVRSVTRERTVN